MSTPRRYDNTRRAEAARRTRGQILEAAREQFLDTGYHSTTVAALARAAQVSPQTIYNAFGGKAEVLKALYDVLLAGDDEPIPMRERPEIIRVTAQPDRSATLRAYAAAARTFIERTGPLIWMVLAEGAGQDAELRAFLETIDRERRIGNTGVVEHIANRFGLGDGVTVERAVDLVWTLTSPENADRLVRRCGWTPADYERWLAEGLVTGLRILSRPAA
ncbi:TetR/AcrR family transcriptional regulator [Kocuria coralli]|uniref:TetR/AcrR family transcriptional regulator n=1 Tax=Kocuria coralli TaxID=1461025 RepID=A0A5J5KUG6_9MICC|nr:TetR/AcrR family transcriptional regulator [Kocuria coralli]KAA9393214.1 TetR/AcrR family transcriptional regulator [Kocuria coralli]